MKNDKTLILNQIKSHYGFKKDVDFAKFLGIGSQTLYTWYSRNTFDYEILYNKCNGINANWLMGGTGNMFNSQEAEAVDKSDKPDYQLKYIQALEDIRNISLEIVHLSVEANKAKQEAQHLTEELQKARKRTISQH